MNILNKIILEKKKAIKLAKQKLPLESLLSRIKKAPKARSFRRALNKKERPVLIAEIKRASPSQGLIRRDFNPVKIAKIYEKSGAVALSVLTEEDFFHGKLDYIGRIKKEVNLPILRKDFIVDEYQIYESRVWGADAILLISTILPIEKLKKFINLSNKLKLDCLVECDCVASLKKALGARAEIIGINNRDLHNFKVDINRTKRLVKFIPKNKIIVSESGIRTKNDVEFLKNLGVNAVLIGETFMKSKDIGAKVKELFG
ncbi:MAG: indole-3-glycerol phosphate synthase TrpC [Candidatus Omnitrophota bacterium]|nr:indole-3-glycerol phosphate synthase TrpC [Candidatus Omnitrophota bacterium]